MFKIVQKLELIKISKFVKAVLFLFDDEEEEEEGDIFGVFVIKKVFIKFVVINKVNIDILMKLFYLWFKFKQFFLLLDLQCIFDKKEGFNGYCEIDQC